MKYEAKIRLIQDKTGRYDNGPQLLSPESIYQFTRDLAWHDRETFVVICMDIKLRVICQHIVSIGTNSHAIVNPSDVFKAAILSNAVSIIIVHNHPSGNPEPSSNDLKMTKALYLSGKILGIPLTEHLIIGSGGQYYSLYEHNQLIANEFQRIAWKDLSVV